MLTIVYILAILVLLILSGFFSGCETALFSLTKWQLRQLEISKKKNARTISRLLNKPRDLLVTILIGNLVVNVSAATVAESFCHKTFEESGAVIAIVSMTILLLVFGEITPKVLAIQFSRGFALFVSYPLLMFEKFIFPLKYCLYNISLVFTRFLDRDRRDSSLLSRDEISGIMDIGLKEGIIKSSEKTIISRILLLSRIKVKQIFIPLEKVFSIEKNTAPAIALTQLVDKGFSRVPVYDQEPANVIGIILMKDLLPYWSGALKITSLISLLHDPVHVKSNQRAMKVFSMLRLKKIHMAMVTDNQDKVIGLVTLQDFVNILTSDNLPIVSNFKQYPNMENSNV